MNKPNGIKDQATLSQKEQKSRHCSSALPTFLKWFKKDSKYSNSRETLSSTQSTISTKSLGKFSPSSSCDSIISTSTTGFAYIKPSNYKPDGIIKERKLILDNGFETNIFTNHMKNYREENNLTLRTKYHLYDADTLKSNNASFLGFNNTKYFDSSLPNVKNQPTNERRNSKIRRHRRTVSESSKEKRSGAYVHVKGKRKAPQPPIICAENQNCNKILESLSSTCQVLNTKNTESLSSSGSTLNKKKRRAPPPPPLTIPKSDVNDNDKLASTSENFFSENDIKAILGRSISTDSSAKSSRKMVDEITSYTSKLTDLQKQTVIEKVVQAQSKTSESILTTKDSKQNPPISPISPKPWYKRPISYNRESSIPFKREVVLKTMEKRKQKQKEKESISMGNALPEVGYTRSSIFDSGSKFGFFLRHKEHSNDSKSKDKEKRRSGIGIPNISELDREAAAIISEEQKAQSKIKDEKYFKTSDQVILQQKMFAPKSNNINNLEKSLENNEENVISTKDLISKFESDSNMSKVSLNTSFIGRSDLFSNNQITTKSSLLSEKTNSSIITNNLSKDHNDEKKNDQLERIEEKKFDFINNDLKDDENCMPKLSWTCPVCTLENPSWRIMCEVCEKLRPFEKFGNFENKINENENKLKKTTEKVHDVKNSNGNTSIIQNNSTNNCEWDKKTEKVMKYFKPRNSNNALTKSSSESIVGKKYQNQFNRKSSSPSKLPIGSPKFNLKNKSSRNNVSNLICNEILENIHNSDTNISLKQDEIKQPLIDSSAIIATVTPVFYASKSIEENNETKINEENHSNVDLKEIRNARILKFTPKQNNITNQSTEKDELLNDPNFLEMEKKRLREKIRAMNAKALTEKYPVLQKTVSVESNNSISSDKEQQEALPPSSSSSLSNHQQEEPKNDVSQGAIKKIPQNRATVDNQTASNSGLFSQTNYDYAVVKPKKVSASAQTSNLIKKDSEAEPKENGLSANTTKNEIPINKFEKDIKEFSKIENSLKSNNQIKIIESQKSKITEKLNDNDKNNIKAPIRYFSKDINRTDTLALTKIMKNLELAISEGNDELAARIAMDLAKMKVSLQVTKSSKRSQKIESQIDENLKINIMIEDKTFKKQLIQFDVKLQMTILELKEKVLKTLNIPIDEQKWYINDKIVNDDKKTLMQYNVLNNSAKFDLKLNKIQTSNLIPTKAICDEIDDLSDDDDDDSLSGTDKKLKTNEIHGAIALPPKTSNNTWECPLCTLINSFNCETCSACSKARPQYIQNNKIENELSLYQHDKLSTNLSVDVLKRIPENKNDLNKSNLNRKSTEIFNIIDDTIQSLNNVLNVSTIQINDNHYHHHNHQEKIAFHFSSPNITKSKYRGVDNFNPNRISFDQQTAIPSTSSPSIPASSSSSPSSSSTTTVTTTKEIENLKIENQQKSVLKQSISTTKTKQIDNKHYLELLDLENSDIVVNLDIFECPICFVEYEPGEGVILRDCLHTFCKDCLKNTIQYSDDAEVKCPYIDIEYSCTSVLQEREIKAIVSKDIYELHLAKSVRVAEHQIENTFHCKTPNCRGWCIYEDNVNQFKCPVCRITNCLTCRVIHDGLSCKQYQDRLNSDCDSNIEARRTKDMLKEMVEKGEAMNCPTCQVVLMKKWGCDWLKCSMCKTEICWVTRGPRWGPAGKGDTSAGCKCGVEGKKCHPKCNYCH